MAQADCFLFWWLAIKDAKNAKDAVGLVKSQKALPGPSRLCDFLVGWSMRLRISCIDKSPQNSAGSLYPKMKESVKGID